MERYSELILLTLLTAVLLVGIVLAWNAQLRRSVRRRTEELRLSREKFRSLLETSSDWIWEVDHNLVFTYSSPLRYRSSWDVRRKNWPAPRFIH